MTLLRIGLAFCLLLLGGCVFKPADIKGNVFITTEGGQSIKLGLVSVGVFTEEEIQKTLQSTTQTFEDSLKERRTKLIALEKDFEEKRNEQDKMKEEIFKLREQLSELEKKRPNNPRYYKTPDTEVFTSNIKETEPFNITPKPPQRTETEQREEKEKREQEVYELMGNQWRDEYDSVKGRLDDLEPKAIVQEVLLEKYNQTLLEETSALSMAWKTDFPDLLFKNLPKPSVETKTDADGNFTLPSPPRGKLAISARFSGNASSEAKSYYWLFFIPKILPKDGRVLLNNDNLLTSNYADSVIDLSKLKE